ncbi:hypothetical protein NBRC116588_18380 [Pyruvatibacter sp. HU-CL02332]
MPPDLIRGLLATDQLHSGREWPPDQVRGYGVKKAAASIRTQKLCRRYPFRLVPNALTRAREWERLRPAKAHAINQTMGQSSDAPHANMLRCQ